MRFLVIVAAALLVACSARQLAPVNDAGSELAYQQRSTRLGALPAWDLSGKLSLDDGHDGGSGKLEWQARPQFDQLDFRGALGKGAWRLVLDENGAELQKADGTVTRAPGIDELVLDEVGWSIPVDSLRWWVLGLAAPGVYDRLGLDPGGHLMELRQHGWDIKFDRYRAFADYDLPGKLVATQGDRRVKLAVLNWAGFPAE